MSDRFMEVYNHHEVSEIAYDPAWANDTGYFDYAVKGENAPVLENGQVVKSVDEQGRKILIVGFALGNIVVFERRVQKEGDVAIYVINRPRTLSRLLPDGALSNDELCWIFGDYAAPKHNIVTELIAVSEELKAK
jgi:hypothetical protein